MKRPEDIKIYIAVKAAMTLVFLWSGVFWSGITALNFFINTPEYKKTGAWLLLGSGVILCGLILCWLRLYALQFIFCAAGFAVYIVPVKEMFDHVEGTGAYFKPSFELRYLPMIAVLILSAALFIIRIWLFFARRSEKKNEFYNSPSESILDKHSGE